MDVLEFEILNKINANIETTNKLLQLLINDSNNPIKHLCNRCINYKVNITEYPCNSCLDGSKFYRRLDV